MSYDLRSAGRRNDDKSRRNSTVRIIVQEQLPPTSTLTPTRTPTATPTQMRPEEQTTQCAAIGDNVSPESTIVEVEESDCRNGRLLLKGRDGEQYVTRYQIDHVQQASGLGRITVLSDCVPCCDARQRRSLSLCLWSVIRSEVFIVILHITSLFLGAFKESLQNRFHTIFPSIIDSSMETLITNTLLIIRTGNAYCLYRDVRHMILYDQSNTNCKNAHVRVLRRWVKRLIGVETALVGCSVGCFVLFLLLDNLWWTIVTNNTCIIITELLYGMYRARVSLANTRIHEDQYKVIIGESVLLLRDSSSFDGRTADKIRIFIDAVENSAMFARPPYVMLCETSTDTGPEDTISELIDPSVSSQPQTESDDTSTFDAADEQDNGAKHVSSL